VTRITTALALALYALGLSAQSQFTFGDSQKFLQQYCQACHIGKTPAGGFHVEQLRTESSFADSPAKWKSSSARVINGEMPPKGAPAPALDLKEQFSHWVNAELRKTACADGVKPGPALTRRLNRDEYAATIRDLLDIHMDLGRMLPEDGAGGEGFDNAAETLFLSPIHSEKYMEAAKFVLEFAAKEHKSRAQIFTARPGDGVTEDDAARRILTTFLPRAFRRPTAAGEIDRYAAVYRAGRAQGLDYESAVLFALRGVLISPNFLFHIEHPTRVPGAQRVDPYVLASRLSYFLWGSMPDEFLFDLAGTGRLHEPQVMKTVIGRMLRNDRSLDFAQRFVEQWLRTREIAREHSPDAELFPEYASDEELRSDIRFQPILFFRELLIQDRPLTDLLDSSHTIGTSNLEKLFDLKLPLDPGRRKQPQWVQLPDNSHRGGLLGMPAVLAVSSYPYRTSPVLRGAWILDSILGTPPPPPPPDVPPLPESKGTVAKTVRERLEQHRASAACASCHSRIDGLGFALENYDVIGRWRTEEAGKPLDTAGELADGTKFNGPQELKTVLLERQELFLRNLSTKMLGYALGRGLTLTDSCAVDQIVSQVRENSNSSQTLIEAVVMSIPFQYQRDDPAVKEARP
jgi:mono/diheme cytochrome c family protein